MLPFSQARFYRAVHELNGLPSDRLAEVAFAGRSNAGKSSAINALTCRWRLAFAAKTPGRTQAIAYFSLGAHHFLVDLPGYGYAGGAAREKTPLGNVNKYLHTD